MASPTAAPNTCSACDTLAIQRCAGSHGRAFGARVQGLGFAAQRLGTNTIWPLIAIHALHDLFLQMGTHPTLVIEVPIVETAAAAPFET